MPYSLCSLSFLLHNMNACASRFSACHSKKVNKYFKIISSRSLDAPLRIAPQQSKVFLCNIGRWLCRSLENLLMEVLPLLWWLGVHFCIDFAASAILCKIVWAYTKILKARLHSTLKYIRNRIPRSLYVACFLLWLMGFLHRGEFKEIWWWNFLSMHVHYRSVMQIENVLLIIVAASSIFRCPSVGGIPFINISWSAYRVCTGN